VEQILEVTVELKVNDLKTDRNRTRRRFKSTNLPQHKAEYQEFLREWRAAIQELKRGDWRRFLAEVDDDDQVIDDLLQTRRKFFIRDRLPLPAGH
ncbi:hypothetical protein FS837_005319, partial [Tulasnella sp. UAMH 9824]